jgi:uncharacterized protein (DUF1800 family)
VQGAATVGAVAGVGLLAPAAHAATPGATTLGVTDLVPADPLRHLLRRATYAPTPASLAEINSLGRAAWLERQLNPAAIVDSECDALLTRLPLAALDINGVHAQVTAGKLKRYSWDVMNELGMATLTRAIWSKRQLLEVMVDFWGNHLNVTCPSGDVWDSRQDYDRTVIRRFALGRFADLLKASARHPAMLSYLDNRSSTRTRPNENYGRELLELHTVGLVHTEADVQNAARLLTGLTVDWETGRYRYDRWRHATGPVRVLGFTHANGTDTGGEAASLAMLDYLALHPATAQRIARKLCVRFVADNPPAALVDRLAKVYLANRSAIAPVLRALFGSPEFAAALGAKVRTPLEDLVATVRTLGFQPEPVDVDGGNPRGTKAIQALLWTVGAAGQAPMAWASPDGYPDLATAWASPSGHLSRWNSHLNIVAGWWPKQLVRPANLITDLAGPLPATFGALVDALAVRLFGRTMHPAHTAAATALFGKTPTEALRANHKAVTWAAGYLVALLLDSPYFTVR